MLGAILIGLSGMDTYSQGLQTISNNVANLNSNGFKQTTLSFANLVNTGGRGAFTGSGFGNGGGNGVHIGSSLTDFGQGELRPTDNDLDLGIQGSGFLVVLSKDGKTFYTRTGSFAVDKDGFISDQTTGDRLAVLDSSGHPVPVHLDTHQTSAPTATTKIVFSDNLSSSQTTASVSSINVFDDRGGEQTWTVNFSKPSTSSNEWTVNIVDAGGNPVNATPLTLRFNGSAVDTTTATQTVSFSPAGADPINVTLDFTQVTSLSSTSSTIQTSSVDGNATGSLTTITVDDDGQILLTYSNTKTEKKGFVALADFRNPEDLARLSNGLFENKGANPPQLLASTVDGIGKLTPKTIEASNVDLSTEFGDLILVQRGFQACSQVVSVSNDMIQQLFAIRGQ